MAIDEKQLRRLYKRGLSLHGIATRLDTSPSTVGRAIKKLGLGAPPTVSPDVAPRVARGTAGAAEPAGPQREALDKAKALTPRFQPDALPVEVTEIITWWQARKTALLQSSDVSRKTERMTFHVEHRWIEALRRQADLDDATYTQIVNEAFRRYFEQK